MTKRRVMRHRRLRKKIIGTEIVPRLTIFRSSKHIYAQVIDDSKAKTIIASSDLGKLTIAEKDGKDDKTQNVKIAFAVGEDVAKKALTKKIKKVLFDRSGYKFHGRVKALAEGARKGGLIF